MTGMEQNKLLLDAIWSYPCIYDIRNGEVKVELVKENALEGYCGHYMQRTSICVSFASVINTTEAVAYSVFFCWIHGRFKYYFANLKNYRITRLWTGSVIKINREHDKYYLINLH